MSNAQEKRKEFIDFLLETAENNSGLLSKLRKCTYPHYFEVGKYIYYYLPDNYDSWNNKCYLIVANLFALHPNHTAKCSFGESLRPILDRYSEDGTSKRFLTFLSAKDIKNLTHHLKSLVKLASSCNAPLNWIDLLEGLCNWRSPNLWVQNKFSSNFWKQSETETETETENQSETN